MPVSVPGGTTDGRLRPLVAGGGNRPGIYAGSTAATNHLIFVFIRECQARSRASSLAGTVSPVNGVDNRK